VVLLYYLKIGHDHFIPCFSQLIIHITSAADTVMSVQECHFMNSNCSDWFWVM